MKHKYLFILLIFIISVPAFISILNGGYFTMHDDQHIARLYLLDQGLRQGLIYPHWVDVLVFNFGYPLFNFYPPLIYYISEFFHLLGASYIWSIKLLVISGFVIGAYGAYLFIKEYTNKYFGLLGSVLYTYYSYHAITAYVRGAMAEFFSSALLPFLFLGFEKLFQKQTMSRSIVFGILIGLLILTHPLIAFPSIIFLLFFFIYYFIQSHDKKRFFIFTALAVTIGLTISSFFWLPSIIEKKYTLVDNILTTELANYRIHYICPQQFWYSPWGFGGSIAGCFDGLSFAIGKLYIALFLISFFAITLNVILKKRKQSNAIGIFFTALSLFSYFMTTGYSAFIWDHIFFLSYLQFPWRFLTFASLFLCISICIGLYELMNYFSQKKQVLFTIVTVILASFLVIFQYHKYFRPQQIIQTSDAQRTSFQEIAWRISRTSFEFSPKGVITKKSDLNTTVIDISQKDLMTKPYKVIVGKVSLTPEVRKFEKKTFTYKSDTPATIQFTVYNFPGWTAQISSLGKSSPLAISDNNDYKLITVTIPPGEGIINLTFQETPIRKFSDFISLASLAFISGYFLLQIKKKPQSTKI